MKDRTNKAIGEITAAISGKQMNRRQVIVVVHRVCEEHGIDPAGMIIRLGLM